MRKQDLANSFVSQLRSVGFETKFSKPNWKKASLLSLVFISCQVLQVHSVFVWEKNPAGYAGTFDSPERKQQVIQMADALSTFKVGDPANISVWKVGVDKEKDPLLYHVIYKIPKKVSGRPRYYLALYRDDLTIYRAFEPKQSPQVLQAQCPFGLPREPGVLWKLLAKAVWTVHKKGKEIEENPAVNKILKYVPVKDIVKTVVQNQVDNYIGQVVSALGVELDEDAKQAWELDVPNFEPDG